MAREGIVCPWRLRGEWLHVSRLVVERDLSVLDIFSVWNSRVGRLPAGVEITIALLEAMKDRSNSMILAASVTRFLNFAAHLGMNEWGVSKFQDVAECLQLPAWLVQVRHDATHGHMPSHTLLSASLELCYDWICTNYWLLGPPSQMAFKKKGKTVDSSYQKLSNLLECHLYLKLYQIWGTERVKDLHEQEDVYSHLISIWPQDWDDSSPLAQMSIKQALGQIKSEFQNNSGWSADLICQVLVEESLLVPEKDFLLTIVGEDADLQEDVEIPDTLVRIWSDLIKRIDEKVGAKRLIDHLVKRIADETVPESVREYCSAWTVLLAEAVSGHSKTANKALGLQEFQATREDLANWIGVPNRLIQMLLPCFLQLTPGLKPAAQQLLTKLLATAVGDRIRSDDLKKAKWESRAPVRTVQDLEKRQNSPAENVSGRLDHEVFDVSENLDSHWRLNESLSRKSAGTICPIDMGTTEGWQSLWLPADTAWQPAQQPLEDPDSGLPSFSTQRVWWPNHVQMDNDEDANTEPEVTDTKESRSYWSTDDSSHPSPLAPRREWWNKSRMSENQENISNNVPAFYRNEQQGRTNGNERKGRSSSYSTPRKKARQS